MTSHLFVYGTLMRRARRSRLGRAMRARLAREALWLGEAKMPGRLIDLGAYPGLVEDTSGASVAGEIWRLRDADAVFRWLDPYEGIRPGAGAAGRPGEYARVAASACLAGGRVVDAWVYVVRGSAAEARPIRSGRWESTRAVTGRRPL